MQLHNLQCMLVLVFEWKLSLKKTHTQRKTLKSAPSLEPFLTLMWFHWFPQQLTNSEKHIHWQSYEAVSPQTQPGDCTSTSSLPALKIEHAALGNESWHCTPASWPAPPNLAVDNIDAGWWAPIRWDWRVAVEKWALKALLVLIRGLAALSAFC